MNSRVIELYWALASFVVLAGIFILWPDLDLAFSSLFAQNDWAWFVERSSRWIEWPYRALPYLGRFLIGGLTLLWLATFVPRLAAIRRLRLLFAFLLCGAVLGPVLLVDIGLKDHLGRARPAHVEPFGGTQRFSPAFVPSDQCDKNCSFVSGHVATTAFIVMAAGWLGSPLLRRRWLLASVVAAGYMGVVRMSVGGHFLSDCIFAWFAAYFGLWLVHAAFARLSRLNQLRAAFAAAAGRAGRTGWRVARSTA